MLCSLSNNDDRGKGDTFKLDVTVENDVQNSGVDKEKWKHITFNCWWMSRFEDKHEVCGARRVMVGEMTSNVKSADIITMEHIMDENMLWTTYIPVEWVHEHDM